MKRFLVFGLLGPAFGILVFLIRAFGFTPNVFHLGMYSVLLIFVYLFGIIPALMIAVIDWWLAIKLPTWPRVAATLCAGYLFGVLASRIIWLPEYLLLRDMLTFGFVGAIPAAICSWLSGRAA